MPCTVSSQFVLASATMALLRGFQAPSAIADAASYGDFKAQPSFNLPATKFYGFRFETPHRAVGIPHK